MAVMTTGELYELSTELVCQRFRAVVSPEFS